MPQFVNLVEARALALVGPESGDLASKYSSLQEVALVMIRLLAMAVMRDLSVTKLIVAILVFLGCSLSASLPAYANSSTKESLIRVAIIRIHDAVASPDADQQLRDTTTIRNVWSKLRREDCVGLPQEFEELSSVIAASQLEFEKPSHDNADVSGMTVSDLAAASMGDPSVSCRCYARREAGLRITFVANALRSHSKSRYDSVRSAANDLWSDVNDNYATLTSAGIDDPPGPRIGPIDQSATAFRSRIMFLSTVLARNCHMTVQIVPERPRSCDFLPGLKTLTPGPAASSPSLAPVSEIERNSGRMTTP